MLGRRSRLCAERPTLAGRLVPSPLLPCDVTECGCTPLPGLPARRPCRCESDDEYRLIICGMAGGDGGIVTSRSYDPGTNGEEVDGDMCVGRPDGPLAIGCFVKESEEGERGGGDAPRDS